MSTPDPELLLTALLTVLRGAENPDGPPAHPVGTGHGAPALEPRQDVDPELERTVERIAAAIAAIDDLETRGSPPESPAR